MATTADQRLTWVGDVWTAAPAAGSGAFNVRDFGAVGDGTTNDTAAIQAAIDAAAIAGGTVLFPAGSYRVTTVNLKETVNLVGQGMFTTRLLGTAGADVLVLPAGAVRGFGISNLRTEGGRRGLAYLGGASAQYCTYVVVRDVVFSGPSAECVYTEGAIEEWHFDNVRMEGGASGFRHANVDNSAANNYVDKCTFTNVLTSGSSTQTNGWLLEAKVGNSITWINPIVNTANQHGMVIDGGFRGLTFINMNTEGNGYSGKNNRTTGSITTGTPTLTVASASGYAIGDLVTVAGAGTTAGGITGADLSSVVANVAGTTITLTNNATGSVTNARVTNARYDDVVFRSTIALPAHVIFLGGMLGGEGTGGHLRYAIDASGCGAALTLANVFSASSLPVYDPGEATEALGGVASVRQVDTFAHTNFQRATIAGPATADEMVRTLLPSPPGRNLILGLRASNDFAASPFGKLEVRRGDAARRSLFHVDGESQSAATYYRFVEQGIAGGLAAIANGATTVDVALYSRWKTANTGATTITNFTNGVTPMTIKLLATDGNTTIANNATIKTNTGANKLLVANRMYTFTLEGTVWYEDA